MSELYFRAGGMEGFTSNKLANRTEGFSTPIRELLQNSLDASVAAGNEKCEVDIYIETIFKNDIPNIKDYERVLELAVDTQRKMGSYNDNAINVVGIIGDALDGHSVDVLMFVDNGVGMDERVLEGLLDERSIKSEEASGSYGAGHVTSYHLSYLRYVLYATKYRDDDNEIKSLWTGSPILAGHQDGKVQRGPKGRIVKTKPKYELNPDFTYPSAFPPFIESKMDNLSSTGTMVVILGLNQEWDRSAEYAIVNSFFPALVRGELIVNIHREGKSSKTVDKNKVLKLVEAEKDRKRKKYGAAEILSGQEVYHAYKAIQEEPEIIQLDNGDEVNVYIKSDIEDSSSIILIRNGMVITNYQHMLVGAMRSLRENENYEPFMVVIDVDKNSAPGLFKLVKGAENVHHNKLEKNRLKPNDEKKLKAILKELANKIKKHLKFISREAFDLPLFIIDKASEKKRGGYGRLTVQRDNAKPKTSSPVRPDKSDHHPGPRPKHRPKPNIELRDLPAKKATRYIGKRKLLEVEMNVKPSKKMDDRDEVYLSIALGEDNDNNRVSQFVHFIHLSVDGNDKPVLKESNQQIPLGMLDEGRSYEILAKVKKPAGFERMRVELLPILKLKRRPKKDSK